MNYDKEVTLLTTGNFLIALAKDIDRSDVSFVEMTFFLFQAGRYLDIIYPSLVTLLKRGGKLVLNVDAVFTGMPTSTLIGVNFNSKNERNIEANSIYPKTKEKLDELVSLGAQVNFVRKPKVWAKFFQSWGRDHRKGAVLKNPEGEPLVIYTGSTNISSQGALSEPERPEEWLGGRDFTLRITNKETMKLIVHYFSLHDEDLPSENISVETPIGTYYLSVGNGSSLIRKRVIQEINDLKGNGNVLIASQLTVDPAFARILRKAAKRGVRVELILPNEMHVQLRHPAFRIAHFVTRMIMGRNCLITYLSKDKWFVHSKAAYIGGSGYEVVYSGSENFPVIQGIWFHTVDDGIVSTESIIVEQVKAHLESHK